MWLWKFGSYEFKKRDIINGHFIPKFGMKKLFQVIYNYFEDKKIDMVKLENMYGGDN